MGWYSSLWSWKVTSGEDGPIPNRTQACKGLQSIFKMYILYYCTMYVHPLPLVYAWISGIRGAEAMSSRTPFRILVGCKRVIDYAVKVRVRADRTGVETVNVKHSMNPFDEIAVEESLRLRDRHGPALISEVVALSIGPKLCQETLKTALAMGADRAVHVLVEEEGGLGPAEIAQVMRRVAEREQARLILLGKQAIDDDCGQTGQILAGLLGCPQATFASGVELLPEEDRVRVAREVDTGIQTLLCRLPAVITTDLRLNQPRYATLQNIMKAKNKAIVKETLETLGLADLKPTVRIKAVTEPPARSGGVMLESVDELIAKLREKGVIA